MSTTTATDKSDTDRPDECTCLPREHTELPCFPCYLDGFETPNPDADPLAAEEPEGGAR